MVELVQKTKSFFIQCKRVWFSLKKPSKKDFEQVVKISGIGILLLGVLGFLISIIMKMITG